MKIKALNGFKDILPEETALWRQVEETAREVFARFAFAEIRLPILEKTELFARSIGEATDIVEKEMYTFTGKQITMRPEATASLLRAYIQHGLYVHRPVQRLFTIGPMFRHERPQKGRLRQFTQLDAEILGSANARIDAELIAMSSFFLKKLGLEVSLELNSLGCPACRPAFRSSLLKFMEVRHQDLCSDCNRRLTTNPLRVLDCKQKKCRTAAADAPSIQENLCPDCAEHFDLVQEGLAQLQVPYRLNRFMVRGLDYYTRTTFEFLTGDLGAQAAVCAGGRYDGLIEQLGGPKLPGIGFATGLERLILLLQQKINRQARQNEVDLFVAGFGEQASGFAFSLVHQLRLAGLRTAWDAEGKSLKSQMKQADKTGAAFVLILGDDEFASKSGILRNMNTGEERQIGLQADEIADFLSAAV
ncbi:MAG: histidine--tRNA ligase [Deltaproteobacteria bacterium]|nr:MAG: histidine--tRNA ligase [Deltaproteobacteria bacterium]